MKNYKITVNGNSYEVSVEEVGSIDRKQQNNTKIITENQKKETIIHSDSSIKILSPMPGNIIDIKVSKGDVVKKNQVIAVLEAMKMENEILSSEDGEILSINVNKGASVNSGDVIATIK